ncbi:MAG: hypothetical protein R3C16_05880 [Hyphomonadaceae bacterium]
MAGDAEMGGVRSLKAVGPNATLLGDDVEAAIRKLKADVDGEIEKSAGEIRGELGHLA